MVIAVASIVAQRLRRGRTDGCGKKRANAATVRAQGNKARGGSGQANGYAILWEHNPPEAGMAELADAADSKSAYQKSNPL